MAQVKIVTDSTAMLLPDEIEKYDIKVIPLTITIDDVTYQDGITISPVEFMDKMAASKNLPQTSQPALGVFTEIYEPLVADGSSVISIHLTKGLSGSVDAARQAAMMVDGDVTVIDSDLIDRSLGMVVLAAAEKAATGASRDEVLAEINAVKAKTEQYVLVSKLDNLVAGGRLSKTAGLLAGMLNIRIGAHVVKGNINVETKGRGVKSTKAYLRKIIEILQAAPNGVHAIGISTAGIPDKREALGEQLRKLFPGVEIVLQQTTPVVATHTGDDAIGFSYQLN
ncbi:MAG TPA: DegV family protein [Weissella thailandensis]|uniref:DegV family protein n=1 Tax=Weissella thailandensis TaxID=89061 RepID=UPI001D7A32C4|nr:DegV family protein [Weissella thailandensis]HJG84196.1 DegV family protein [Weissella thailandensis]